jgi:thioredoxin reductase (NADPH)
MDETIRVYGASWCGDCRRAKRFLGDQRIAYEWHDIEQEPDLLEVVHRYNDGKNTIPTIVFPDGSHLAEPSNEDLAEKLGLERTAMQHVYDLVIVGGGPAGLTTAIYAARENLETLIVDSKGLGGQAGVTERLDNYPGFPDGIGGAELADRFVRQAERYGVEMLQALSVSEIRDEGGGEIELVTANDEHLHARAVLVATGSSYRRTGAEGEEDLIGAGVHFCATCDGPFYRGAEELMVLGGGNSGLEEGLFLTQFARKVTVVEYNDALAGSQVLQDKVLADPKMEVLLRRKVIRFAPKDDASGKVGTVTLEDLENGATEDHHPAGVFVFIGLDPNTGFLKGVVDLDERGFVATDAGFMTSLPGVFAAGDVRGGSTKQLASAVGEGAAVAIQIRRYLDRQLEMAGTEGA